MRHFEKLWAIQTATGQWRDSGEVPWNRLSGLVLYHTETEAKLYWRKEDGDCVVPILAAYEIEGAPVKGGTS